jgi:ubiquinol-cytochrome c reductase subunit 7
MLVKVFRPFINIAAKWYQPAIANKLKPYGLRYEDLYDPQLDLDVDEALRRLPQDIVDKRNQRLKRALDLSMKHSELSPDMQAKQTPMEPYMEDTLRLVKLEGEERAAIGAGSPYERSIP